MPPHRWFCALLTVHCSLVFALLACLPRHLKLVAGLPFDGVALFARKPAQHKSKPRELRVTAKIPVGMILIGRLMIVMLFEVRELRTAPRFVVPFEQHTLIHRERRNAGPRQRKVIGAIVVAC